MRLHTWDFIRDTWHMKLYAWDFTHKTLHKGLYTWDLRYGINETTARQLNIEYYQFVVHGTHEIFPKWLQRRWRQGPKISENPCPGLHFEMLLGLGASPGTPWRPCWDGDPKNHKKITFGDPLFGAYLWQVLVLLWWLFFACFLNPTSADFLVSKAPARTNLTSMWAPSWSQSE